MKLYLFGGSSKETEAQNDQIISEQLALLQPKQLLYIDFARTNEKRREQKLSKIRQNVAKIKDCCFLFYFGSSAGAMIAGEKVREENDKPPFTGLNILPKTIIEPHYSQWNRHNLLCQEMKDWSCPYGIGIDEACGIIIDPRKFPQEYQAVGQGTVEVIQF